MLEKINKWGGLTPQEETEDEKLERFIEDYTPEVLLTN